MLYFISGKILGDNGYACKKYLLTPVLNPVSQSERNYNLSHKRTRNIIERLFGVWKKRFPCLRRGLTTKLNTSVLIICAAAILHNIGILYNDHFEEVEDEVDDDNDQDFIIDNPNADPLHYRRAFIIRHFSNL